MKHKGAALATAIMLCTFLLLITFGVTSLVIQTANLNRASEITRDQKIAFLEASEKFREADGAVLDPSIYDGNNLTYKRFDEGYYTALCAYVGGDSLKFYAVYNFSTDEVLAFQTANLYVVDGKVAGLVNIYPEVSYG